MRELIETVKQVLAEEKFQINLDESLAQHTQHVTHLSHAEDLGHEYGHAGTEHAIAALHAAKNHIKQGHHNENLTTKIDGGVSVVAGKHPVSGKHFIAYKGELGKIGSDKETKVAYSHADVDKHFGDKPYLVHKMKAVLDHAHKILPKEGIYQGDMLFDKEGKHEEGGKVSFEPNTIKYSAKKDSAEGRKISKAPMGISFHTAYDHKEGQLHSRPVKTGEIGSHEDVYHLSTANDTNRAHMTGEDEDKFHHHMNQAQSHHEAGSHSMHDAVSHVKDHVSTYINQTVRTGEKPTTEGLHAHILAKGEKEASKVKTEKSKLAKLTAHGRQASHVLQNKEHIGNYFQMHHHLQQAKHALVRTLDNADHPLEHTIEGKKTAPEGYVFHHAGAPIKLVNREEFAKANFAKARS